MVVPVQGLDVIALLVVQEKMYSLVIELDAMENLDLLGKYNVTSAIIFENYCHCQSLN